MTFHLNCRYALVTYPQCGDLQPQRLVEHFAALGSDVIIGREDHADGGTHLHVFADFKRKFRSRQTSILDVDGHHPNISPSKGTPEKGYDYAIKDGDIVGGTLARPEPRRAGNGSTSDKWTIITNATTRDEFWKLAHELDPKSAVCSFNQLQKWCDWRFAPVRPTYQHPRGIEFVESNNDGRHSWLLQSGIGSGEPLIGMCHMFAQLPATPGNITKLGWSSGYSGPRPSANPSPQPARKLHSNFTDSGR